ncbi:hypothetical protein FJTKL_04916 [Diaporthe vaccinii]|uniref:Uncharacterized protein n=1 Tax=Diaporthe vaccinii TaxID=105482 RepID=A0ABR4DRV6_9PEZI
MGQSRKDQESKKKIRSRQAASIQVRFENPKCGTAVDFCPDPMSAFEEVLAVLVVVPEQTKMTSKSATLESGSTPYRMNRSVERVGSQKCAEGRKSKSSVR